MSAISLVNLTIVPKYSSIKCILVILYAGMHVIFTNMNRKNAYAHKCESQIAAQALEFSDRMHVAVYFCNLLHVSMCCKTHAGTRVIPV